MKVLTCEWVNGEKLSESNATDLLPLITTTLNCYLVQLLETGFLHADPHPGNLLRTPDGHLCVLDFGLMTEVPSFAGILHNNGH
jgi:aarF domain-containing kinase